MNSEIIRLGLPRGKWQSLIKTAVPVSTKTVCTYPDDKTLCVEVFKDSISITKFSLSFLYGCKGILISHSASVSPSFRGKGIAKALQPIKQKIAEDLQISLMLATVRDDNVPQTKVFKHWKKLDTFRNKRTGNQVNLFVKPV